MKAVTKFFLAVILGLAITFGFPAQPAAFAQATALARNLKAGDSGQDVLLLQKFLNDDAVTRVAQSGPGSPGQESSFFGALTTQAVVRFQEKYAAEVLAPAGLSSGTGFVGTLTRQKINGTLASGARSLPAATITATTPTVVATAPVKKPVLPSLKSTFSLLDSLKSAKLAAVQASVPSLPIQNPNAQNLDVFLNGLSQVQVQNGVDPATATRTMDSMRQIALTTTTDFRGQFTKTIAEKGLLTMGPESVSCTKGGPLSLWKKLQPLFAPDVATAAIGVPFGGPPIYIFPCTCSPTTIIAFGPPWNKSVFYLDYVYGTQLRRNYNAPAATEYLGAFLPGAGDSCYIFVPFVTGCIPIFSEGMIEGPYLGSNAI